MGPINEANAAIKNNNYNSPTQRIIARRSLQKNLFAGKKLNDQPGRLVIYKMMLDNFKSPKCFYGLFSFTAMCSICPALVAVPYAAKKRHTSLPPPQPFIVLALLNNGEMINKK